jgi:hypothetical protein
MLVIERRRKAYRKRHEEEPIVDRLTRSKRRSLTAGYTVPRMSVLTRFGKSSINSKCEN